MDMNKDLVAASATPLVLAILAEGDSYGYAIIKRVAELSGGHLQWTDGMLYPVLHRLERQGLVAAKWSAPENGRKRKYYRITREGRAQLAAQRQQWQAVDDTLRGIWMLVDSELLNKKFVRIAPHIVDTVLLVTAFAMAWMIGQYPFTAGWLTAKFVALIAYLVLRAAQACQDTVEKALEFARLVRLNLMHRRPIDALRAPKPPPPNDGRQMAFDFAPT